MCHHTIIVGMYAFAISYAIFMHLGSTEEITLLEFNEEEEGDQQEIPQAAAPKEEEQTPEELSECPDHHPTCFLKGKPWSILRVCLVELWLWEKATAGCELWKSCCGL